MKKLPIGISFLGWFLVLVGVVDAVGFYIAPSLEVLLPGIDTSVPINHAATWMLGARSLAPTIALVLGLLLRNPALLGAMMVLRCVVESLDVVSDLTFGFGSVVDLCMAILALCEAGAAVFLFRQMSAKAS